MPPLSRRLRAAAAQAPFPLLSSTAARLVAATAHKCSPNLLPDAREQAQTPTLRIQPAGATRRQSASTAQATRIPRAGAPHAGHAPRTAAGPRTRAREAGTGRPQLGQTIVHAFLSAARARYDPNKAFHGRNCKLILLCAAGREGGVLRNRKMGRNMAGIPVFGIQLRAARRQDAARVELSNGIEPRARAAPACVSQTCSSPPRKPCSSLPSSRRDATLTEPARAERRLVQPCSPLLRLAHPSDADSDAAVQSLPAPRFCRPLRCTP